MPQLALPHFHSGKVRDTYLVPEHPSLLLQLASDRISTHNVKHKTLVPNKGALLMALTVFWTLQDAFKDVRTHLVAWGRKIYDYPIPQDDPELHYRAIIVRKCSPDPREFVWRNYLSGSLEPEYRAGRDPYGLQLPPGLPKMHHFEEPIFTPTMKSEHDEPVGSNARNQYPEGTQLSGKVFARMSDYLLAKGIGLIDSKMETAGATLIDEWGTGDCCRMAFLEDIREGADPPWLDKEVFREAAKAQWGDGPEDPLSFPDSVVDAGVRRYHIAFEAITGMSLVEFQRQYFD